MHLAAAFEHFDGLHARHVGEVVGGRRGVGRGSNENTILHEGDALASFGFRAAQTDVGAQAEAVFFVDIDARHTLEQAVNVGIAHALNFLWRDIIGRPRAVAGFKLAAEHLSGIDDHFRDFEFFARGVRADRIRGVGGDVRRRERHIVTGRTKRYEPQKKETDGMVISHKKVSARCRTSLYIFTE